MQQTHQATVATFSTPIPPPSSSGGSTAKAPPKQIALAMDKLGQAERIIADIRIGADRLLEALFISANQPHQDSKPLQVFLNENACMHQQFQELRSLGKELEEDGVLSESPRSRKDLWGLHMPLVCPDGTVVALSCRSSWCFFRWSRKQMSTWSDGPLCKLVSGDCIYSLKQLKSGSLKD